MAGEVAQKAMDRAAEEGSRVLEEMRSTVKAGIQTAKEAADGSVKAGIQSAKEAADSSVKEGLQAVKEAAGGAAEKIRAAAENLPKPEIPQPVSDGIAAMRRLATQGVDSVLGWPPEGPVTGIAFIQDQLREMVILAACGACIAFLFQVYSGAVGGLSRRVLVVTDLLFCIGAGILILQFWFRSSYGRLSLHEALGFGAGFLLGMRIFQRGKTKPWHTAAVFYVILMVIACIVIS